MTPNIRPANQRAHRGWIPGEHRGDDYGHASGDQIYAINEGIVEYVYDGTGNNSGWGRRIIIRHTDRATSSYNHMGPGGVLVKRGDRVRIGQHIAIMGSSGKSTAKHLHHEIYIDGQRVNPSLWIGKVLPGTPSIAPAPASAGGGSRVRVVARTVNARVAPNTSAKANRKLAAGVIGNFDGFIRGERVTQNGITSDIWFRGAYNGEFFWSGNFTSQSTDGLADLGSQAAPAPAPAKRRYVHIVSNWIVYQTEQHALQADPKWGTVPPGDYLVLSDGGPGKPVQIQAPGQNGVRFDGPAWIGSSKTAAPQIWK